ncbi:PREDICTED: P-selectin-like, partial [Branchiostoma belcheri]|uniref:P-selectin-like n=1 Tax=Branchiostoma belcheri TaxID=7741 RepID=A0A6P4XP75_BRABE
MAGSCLYKGVMHFRCARGYNLVGAANIRCQADGTWSGSVPTCEAVQCPELKPPIHGNMDGSFSYKAAVHFNCDRGYNLVGAATITCQADAVQCTEPRPPIHGYMDGSRNYQGVMHFSCDRGYNLVGAATIRCQADAVQCTEPRPPINGYMDGSRNYHGMMRFRCDRGYNLVGAATITCQADAVQCTELRPPVYGYMDGSRNYQGVMNFRCAHGYNLVGAKTITCQADGTWSDSVPTCKAAGCKKVEPPVNGQMKKRRNKGNNYLEFRCNQGYRLVGEKYIVCQPDGTWSDSVPKCKAICRGDYQLLAETCIRISFHRSQYSEAEGA